MLIVCSLACGCSLFVHIFILSHSLVHYSSARSKYVNLVNTLLFSVS